MTVKEFWSNIVGKCEQCGEEEALFYDEDANLLCSDCLFENECETDFDYLEAREKLLPK